MDGQRHAPAALPPGKRSSTHCIGGWVGHMAGLQGPALGLNPRTVQSVATDRAIPAHKNFSGET